MKSIKNKNILIFFFCLLFQLTAIGQKSESGYVKEVKLLYVKGLNQEAKDSLEAGLKKYPTSTSLAQLVKIIEDEGIAVKKPSSPTSKTQEGGAITSHTPIVNTPRGTNTVEKLPPIEKKKVVEIDISLKMNEQNVFSWNESIAKEGLQTTIIIDNGSSVPYQKDVTGMSSYKFKSGDTRYDGVKCNVKLVIESNEFVKVKGTKEIRVKTTC